MPSYDPARHHRRSIRLPGYDYTQPGAYFVTIVTHRRAHLFGEVMNGDMRLNAWGDIVRDEWFKTAHIRPYVQLRDDEFVVMPNHIHGIIWIVGSPNIVGATRVHAAAAGDDDGSPDIVGATRRVAATMGDPIPPGVPTNPSGATPIPPAAPTEPREVADDDMRLNAWGDIVRDEWFKTAHIRPYVQLRDDEFVVMPNHIHGIIWIVGSPNIVGATSMHTAAAGDDDGSPDIVGATRRVAPTMGAPIPPGVPTEPRGPIPQSIGAIIGQFKSIVTKRIHASHGVSGTPIWQRNYYEHIIRHERALNAIRRYIIDNPRRWHLDRENARRTGSDPLAREIWAMLQEDDQRHVAEGGQ